MRTPLAILLTLTATLLLGVAPAQAACAGEDAKVTSANIAAAEASVVCLVNEFRAAQGVGALTVDSRLASAARAHSQDMVTRNYFSHVNKSGQGSYERIVAAGYPEDSNTGENIVSEPGDVTPRFLFDTFLASSDHRANMVDDTYRDIGVGIVANAVPAATEGETVGATATQTFGGPYGTSGGGCDLSTLEAKVDRLKRRKADAHGSERRRIKKKLKRAKQALRDARANC